MGYRRLITPKTLVSCSLEDPFLEKIDRIAERRGVSRASILRKLLYKGWAAYQAENKAKKKGDN